MNENTKCPALLMIKGEAFPCDWEGRNPDGTHTGWAHTNKDAEAVWSGTADDEKLSWQIPKGTSG